MGDNTMPTVQVSKKRLFVEAIGFDAACRKITRQYPNARLFNDLTVR